MKTQKIQNFKLPFAWIIAIIASLLVVVLGLNFAQATTFSQTYKSNGAIGVGTVVSLAKSGQYSVESTTSDNDTRVIGVVSNSDSSIIDLQSKNTNLKVTLNGEAKILVTDIGGEIKAGDSLMISPLSGVAMKDAQGFPGTKYVAIAEQDFSSKNLGNKQVNVTLVDGSKKNYSVGEINANILISERPPQKSTKARSFLSTIGEKIVGRPVSTLRVITSAIILFSSLVITGLMLNASVKGSFVSLGRNPLARSSIIANLLKIILLALVIFETGLVAAYLVLSL